MVKKLENVEPAYAQAQVDGIDARLEAIEAEKKELGDHKLNSGPVIARGAAAHTVLFERLVDTAKRAEIGHTITASPRFTSTDADSIYLSRAGVATGLISVPNRYMHSPNEMVSLKDLEQTAKLIAAFVRELTADTDLVPR